MITVENFYKENAFDVLKYNGEKEKDCIEFEAVKELFEELEKMKCCGNCKCYRKLKVSVYECTLADGDQPCNPIVSGDHVCNFWECKSI